MKNYWLCLWIGIAVWSLSGTVSAVVLRPMDDSELIARSTHVSLSRVVKIESFWKEGRILSWVKLVPLRVYRGGQASVRILVPGGTVDNLTQVVPGAPSFEIGSQALYFLEPLPKSDGYRLVGFSHGVVARHQAVRFERLWTLLNLGLPTSSPEVLEHSK